MAYGIGENNSKLLDSDGHTLRCRILNISEVGGRAFAILWNSAVTPQTRILPGGVGTTSFLGGETIAIYHSLHEVKEKFAMDETVG